MMEEKKSDSKYLGPAGSAPLQMYPACTEGANAVTLYEITRIINYTYRKEGRCAGIFLMGDITAAFWTQGRSARSGVSTVNILVEPEVSQDEPCRFTSQVRDKKTGRIVRPPKDADPPLPIACFDPALNRMCRIAMRPDGTPEYVGLEEFVDPSIGFC